MFLASTPEVIYRDPWNIPFEQRISRLQTGDFRVAYLYERPDTSTFRYRVYNMIQALAHSGERVSATFFSEAELDDVSRALPMLDALVVCRWRYSAEINRVITKARFCGKKVFFDIDDLVFDTDHVHLVLHTLDQSLKQPQVYDHWFAYCGRLGGTMRLCDEVIVTNDFLAAHATAFSGKRVHVIPNFMNDEQLAVSDAVFEAKRASDFARSEAFHIGYFSGTPTHRRDFRIASAAIAQAMRAHPQVRLRLVGFMEPDPALNEFTDRIETFPLQDFLNLQRLIGAVELNVVPLQDNTFTNCKSELKYFEAAAVGTVTVASPTHAFRQVLTPERGYLANEQDWETVLNSLVASRHTYADMACRAREHARDAYSSRNQGHRILAVLRS